MRVRLCRVCLIGSTFRRHAQEAAQRVLYCRHWHSRSNLQPAHFICVLRLSPLSSPLAQVWDLGGQDSIRPCVNRRPRPPVSNRR